MSDTLATGRNGGAWARAILARRIDPMIRMTTHSIASILTYKSVPGRWKPAKVGAPAVRSFPAIVGARLRSRDGQWPIARPHGPGRGRIRWASRCGRTLLRKCCRGCHHRARRVSRRDPPVIAPLGCALCALLRAEARAHRRRAHWDRGPGPAAFLQLPGFALQTTHK